MTGMIEAKVATGQPTTGMAKEEAKVKEKGTGAKKGVSIVGLAVSGPLFQASHQSS